MAQMCDCNSTAMVSIPSSQLVEHRLSVQGMEEETQSSPLKAAVYRTGTVVLAIGKTSVSELLLRVQIGVSHYPLVKPCEGESTSAVLP